MVGGIWDDHASPGCTSWVKYHTRALATLCPLPLLPAGTKVTDSAIASLASCCHCLSNVNFTGMRSIGDHALSELARHCTRLNSLSVCETRFVKGPGLASIAATCTELVRVWVHLRVPSQDTLVAARHNVANDTQAVHATSPSHPQLTTPKPCMLPLLPTRS